MRIVLAALVCLCVLACAATFQSDFYKLHRLQGVWKMEGKKGAIFEEWIVKGTNELQGESYFLKGTDTVVLESVQLIQNKDGVFYIPLVADQNDNKPVTFKLVSWLKDRYVFENPEHDFPQRVIYQFIRPDSIVARIEGDKGGQFSSSDFYYKKVK